MHTHAAVCVAASLKEAALPERCYVPSPDVHIVDVPTLQIDSVRSLQTISYRTPVAGDVVWIVICARDWTVPAQNALLKILEEPPAHARFVLVVSSLAKLLPTVQSRLESLPILTNEDTQQLTDQEVLAWLAAGPTDRLRLITSLQAQSDAVVMADFLQRTLRVMLCYRHQYTPEILRLIADTVEQSNQPGVSRKYVLEALALSIPIVTIS